MKHRTAHGRISYVSEQSGAPRSFGGEWFSLTEHEDGQRTLRAYCEIEAGVVAPRDVVRDVTYTTDRAFAPLECYSRIHMNGAFMGSGWMRFTETAAECESFNAAQGRVSQRVDLPRPARSVGSHPVSCDAFHAASYDHSLAERIQQQPDIWMTSLEHDGCSGPMLARIRIDVEYCGRESVTVPAGTFECEHYRYLLGNAGQPQEHPTEDVWCLPDSFLLVRATVGGYMKATFDLIEFTPWR